MQTNSNQISFPDIYSNLDEYFQQDKPKLIELFENYIDLNQLIPQSFYNHYYSNTGHPRVYKLSSMISALVIKSLLSIADTSLFINVLNLSSELRKLCGFNSSVPNASQFSRFKITFEKDLKVFFNYLVEITEPLCESLNKYLNDILIVDTTGIKAYVKENNPKHFDTLLRHSKKLSKNNPDFNPHAYACSKMPKYTYANSDIKLSYINGHYCYALKTAIVTNGLGIIRDIDFFENNIDISKSESANLAKDEYDSKSLIPTLKKFFNTHDFKYKYFLGDAGFDAIDNYKFLYKDKHIIPIIPLRRAPSSPKPGFTEDGIPTCPNNTDLLMKFDGVTREKGRADRIKWLCPKSKKTRINGKTQYILSCNDPCTDSKCGKIYQVPIDNDFRMNISIPRNSKEWIQLYKIRTIIERTNFILKYPLSLNYTKLNNTSSLKSELILSAITQLIVLLIACSISETDKILSIKKFVA